MCLFRHVYILNCFVAMDLSVQYLSLLTLIGTISLLVKTKKRWEWGVQLIIPGTAWAHTAFPQLRSKVVFGVYQSRLKRSFFDRRIGKHLVTIFQMSFYSKCNSYADQQVFRSVYLVHMCQCTSIFVCRALTLSISCFFNYMYNPF